ncbi:MAG: hypothetical protein PHN37_02980 [Candidatus Pacebacteria bacterium]|nr:hypothetical protein [Candidatus Paceibacterota bacterium]
MQKNKAILSLIIIILIILIGFYIFVIKQNNIINLGKDTTDEGLGLQDNNNLLEVDSSEILNDIIEEKNKIITDDFSIELPLGWNKIDSTIPGVLAMAINSNEKINDLAAQKINFKSYLAISLDILEEKTINEYLQTIKNELQKNIPNIIFYDETDLVINGKTTCAVEAEMIQQGVNFKVLILVIKQDNENVWVLSYNTTKSNWDKYKEEFSNSANSFILK